MNNSVTAILLSRFNLEARPGAKVECPFCHHDTLAVKGDDSLAKCFHPSCGRFVGTREERGERRLGGALQKVFSDFHAELLKQAGSAEQNAYNYCVSERGIHPCVVADSMLGVVPARYDSDGCFAVEIANLRAARVEECKSNPRLRDEITSQLDALIEAQKKLSDCIAKRPGWLAFFLTDSFHRIVSIRFREPYTKNIAYFKPGTAGGVFNRELFIPLRSEANSDKNGYMIVVEGEFNQLQLQSLAAKLSERNGGTPKAGYVHACAVGGVHNADLETLKRSASKLIICYDNDASGAGRGLVDAVAKVIPCAAFTTPALDSDLDSFIRDFGEDVLSADRALRELVASRKPFYRDYESVKIEIDEVRRSQGRDRKEFEVVHAAANLILADLRDRAQLFNDRRSAFLFLSAEKKLIQVDLGEHELQALLHKYGILPSERIAVHVVDALRIEAFERGTETDVHLFSHFDTKRFVLYVSNLGQQVCRITSQGMDVVDNGTDGVLFLRNPKWMPFNPLCPLPDGSRLDELIIRPIQFEPGTLATDDCSSLFLTWVFTLFFPELFPTRPIIALIGEKGCIKTAALRSIGTVLYGAAFDVMQVSEDAKDLDASLTNEPYVVLDNVDKKMEFLEDKLAIIATGATIKRRELYTTNRLVEFPIRAAVGITSRTPHFRREDVAERLLPLHLVRREVFLPQAQVQQQLLAHREEIIAELLAYLKEIVAALERQAGATYSSKFRMADFADFALKIAHAQGNEEKMRAILDRLTAQQVAFATEGEPIFELLDEWLRVEHGQNVMREVTTTVLCKELGDLADRLGIEFPYRGKTRAFAQRIRNIKGSLQGNFEVTERKGHARALLLRFAPKTRSDEAATEKPIPPKLLQFTS